MKRRKGFTIVELVIVIAVIAILAAVLIPTFSSMIDEAKDSQFKQNARNDLLEKAIEENLGVNKTENVPPQTSESQTDVDDEPVFATISYSDGKEARQIKASELPSYDDIMSVLAGYSSTDDVKYIQDFLAPFKPIIEDVTDSGIVDIDKGSVKVSTEDIWNVYLTSDGYIFMFRKNTENLLGSVLIFTQSPMPFYMFYGIPSLLDSNYDLYQPLYTLSEEFCLNPAFVSPKEYECKSDNTTTTITLTINK